MSSNVFVRLWNFNFKTSTIIAKLHLIVTFPEWWCSESPIERYLHFAVG